MTKEIQLHLKTYYERVFPEKENPRIGNLSEMSAGWESVIYAFDASYGPLLNRKREEMILRIYPGADAHEKSLREFEGLQRLLEADYPVPRVYSLERANSPFEGRPFMLMERISGEMMWPILDRSEPDRAAQLITQFCALFVKLHALEWHDFVPAADRLDYEDLYAHVDRYLGMLRRATEAYPDLNVFSPIIDWLQSRRTAVPCPRPSPVHLDFHPGNVILTPDGAAVVIDWTQIQVSDPRLDLAWTLLLAGAYAGDNVRKMILVEYERILGVEVEHLPYFDVAACVKRIATVMLSLSAGADQMGMRPEAVENMRRDFPALEKMYQLMVDRTGIRISQVEQLLVS